MKRTQWITLLISGIMASILPSYSGSATKSGVTADQAKQTAIALSGISPEHDKTVKISVRDDVLAAEEDVPCLALTGHPIWRVTFTNVALVLYLPAKNHEYAKPDYEEKGGKPVTNPNIHQLDVLVDRQSGQLIKITTPFPKDTTTEQKLTALHAFETDLKATSTIYEGLPEKTPRFSFLQALQSAQEGIGGPIATRQLEAIYVQQRETFTKNPAAPRWIIVLRYLHLPKGLERHPIPLPGVEIKEEAPSDTPKFVTIRHEIDPTTGQWIGAGNIPDKPV